MLDSDLRLLTDPSFRVFTDRYAADKGKFFDDFSAAFSKLGELGWAELMPVSYTIPDASPVSSPSGQSDRNLLLKSGMELSWTLHQDGNVSITLTLDSIVGWIGLGVSIAGRMVSPQPSLAVVATSDGVHKRRLETQTVLNVAKTAPMDIVQDLHEPSFVRADGKSTLHFRTPLSWLTSFSGANSTDVWLVFAHGSPSNPNEAFAYHGFNRGNMKINGFASPANQTSTQQSSESRSVRPNANILLTWVHEPTDQTT